MDNKFEEAWKLFKEAHPDELFAKLERTVAEVFWESAMQQPREIEATDEEFDLWLGLKKRVHELENEVAALRALNIASLTDAAKILELTKELAASREKAKIIEEMYDQEYGLEHGTIAKQLDVLAAERAAVREKEKKLIEHYEKRIETEVSKVAQLLRERQAVSDTSFYDARIYEEQLRTECLRQEAAQREIEYWKLKLAQIYNTSVPAEPTKEKTDARQ